MKSESDIVKILSFNILRCHRENVPDDQMIFRRNKKKINEEDGEYI